MKILVDENMPLAEHLFSSLGTVVKKPGRGITRQDLLDVDALMVRSVTQVDAATLAGTPVKFVGTATIGTDHLALADLATMGVKVVSAPGCNAQAVVEYVCAALLVLEQTRRIDWRNATIGIVGVGNVGRRLRSTLQAMGCRVIACDPLLAAQGEAGLVSFAEVSEADIISFHTPLTRDGDYPTWHLAGRDWLSQLGPSRYLKSRVLINAARGAVIDNLALSEVLSQREDLVVVLDVWEGEPLINEGLARQVDIATPHIAGYSFDGKAKGSWQIYQQFCEFLGVAVVGDWQSLVPADHRVTLDLQALSGVGAARAVVERIYNILEDDGALRNTLGQADEARRASFDGLRKHYRLRREFGTVMLENAHVLERWSPDESGLLQALGFNVRGDRSCG